MLWRVFGRGQAASAGRVQSVAVRLVVERERARMRFRSGAWHDLEGTFVAAATRSSRSAPRSSSSTAARLAEGRDFDPATGPARAPAATSCCSTATRRDGARRPAPRRAVPGRERRVRSVHRATARAVHDLDAAAGVEPQAALHRGAHDGGRAAALRAGYITYMRTDSTNLSEQAITAARDRDPRAVRRRVPAGRAARVPQQGEERAGGARGDPARGRRDPHSRRGARRARRRRAAALRAHLDPHGRVPDGRRARPQDDDPARARRRPHGEQATFRAVGQDVRLPRLAARVRRRRRRGRRGRSAKRACPSVAEGDARRRARSSRRSATRRSRRRATPKRAS